MGIKGDTRSLDSGSYVAHAPWCSLKVSEVPGLSHAMIPREIGLYQGISGLYQGYIGVI